jgi:hypothetical protein
LELFSDTGVAGNEFIVIVQTSVPVEAQLQMKHVSTGTGDDQGSRVFGSFSQVDAMDA